MNLTRLKTFIISLLLGFLLIGIFITKSNYSSEKNEYNTALEEYNQRKLDFKQDSLNVIKNIHAPKNNISFRSTSSSEAYLSASQGIEVHLTGLNWRGHFIDNHQPIINDLRTKYDAFYKQTINKIEFDPDFENCGYPDLILHIKNSPSFYRPNFFSKYLEKKDPKPYKSFELNSCDKRKAIMDLWLVTFDLTFRIEPNENYNRNKDFDYEGRHPITQKLSKWSRNKKEFKETRYDRMSVLLEFKPKDFFYLSSDKNSSVVPLNQSPKIGIGAVECVQIVKVGEDGLNNKDRNIGIQLEEGESLPLYPSLDNLINEISYKNKSSKQYTSGSNVSVGNMVSKYENIVDICGGEQIIADTNFFNKTKYSIIDIKNLGSWKQDKSWMLGKTEFIADYFHAEFLVHLYVLGEWVVKDENLISFEARPPTKITKPGVFDYILPDFNLGFGGKFAAGIILPILLLLFLSFAFPPIGTIINSVLKKLIGN